MGIEEELDKVIFKDKTLVSCENKKCRVYGEMWWCYLGNEKNCGLYRTYKERLDNSEYK